MLLDMAAIQSAASKPNSNLTIITTSTGHTHLVKETVDEITAALEEMFTPADENEGDAGG